MTFKEFTNWCNERACDGYWSMNTALFCIQIVDRVMEKPFWKREREWQRINREEYDVISNIVSAINAKIKDLCGIEAFIRRVDENEPLA